MKKNVISPPPASPRVVVSWGELIDKITILEIKKERIPNPDALVNVLRELDSLSAAVDAAIMDAPDIQELKESLSAVNRSLWQIEDDIREKEKAKQFDDQFIALARSVYGLNDERAAIKKRINEFLHSEIVEEKSYKS
jgi:cob(I)alamin adenosyltransferase